jgi:hypothetical protein
MEFRCRCAIPRNGRGDTGSTMITIIVPTFFGSRLTEGTGKVGRTKAAHVVVNIGCGPDMMHRGRFGWGLDAHDADAIVFALQSTLGDRAGFEFAMKSFPTTVAQTRNAVDSGEWK